MVLRTEKDKTDRSFPPVLEVLDPEGHHGRLRGLPLFLFAHRIKLPHGVRPRHLQEVRSFSGEREHTHTYYYGVGLPSSTYFAQPVGSLGLFHHKESTLARTPRGDDRPITVSDLKAGKPMQLCKSARSSYQLVDETTDDGASDTQLFGAP